MKEKVLKVFFGETDHGLMEKETIFDMGGVERILILEKAPLSLQKVPQGFEITGGPHFSSGRKTHFSPDSKRVLLFGPNEPHEVHHHKNTSTEAITLFIDPKFISRLFQELNIQGEKVEFERIESQFHPKVYLLVSKIIQLHHLEDMGKENFDYLFSELILSLLPYYKNNVERKVRRSLPTQKCALDIKKSQEKMREMIFDDSSEEIDFENISQMNKFHFLKHFERSSGSSALAFLNQLKLDFAKDKLISSNWPIPLIGEKLGFGAQQVFHYFFSKEVGISPSEFRAMFSKLRGKDNKAA